MAIGIVAEFNPFHNGHKHLIKTAKTMSDDGVVAVMSGAFVQRGGIAITDKWTRAEMALKNGCDLVLELPCVFSHNTAQRFASGAISTLWATGIVRTLAFGSECGNKEQLKEIAGLLSNEPEEVSKKIKELMDAGLSYPAAREQAYSKICDTSPLKTPNDILAVEYLRACHDLRITPEIMAIPRIGTDHDSTQTNGNIASASEIRRKIHSGGDATPFMPCGNFVVYDPNLLDFAVISKLRLSSPEDIVNIVDMTEGLENKFIAEAKVSTTVLQLIEGVKSKRYTLSRLRRIAYSVLLGLTKELSLLAPTYIRVLGMNAKGRELLKQMKQDATLPVIIKAADYNGDEIFDFNTRAEDIFSMCSLDVTKRNAGQDIRKSPVII